jgi:hypothetical protein
MCTAWKTRRLFLALHVDDALGAQNVGAATGQQVVQPGGDLLAVHGLVQGQGDPLHAVIVDVALVVVAMVAVVVTAMLVMHVAMVMPMVVMMMIVAAVLVMDVAVFAVGRVEEVRLQLGDPFQVEAVLAQDGAQRDVRALGAVDRGQRVDALDAGLDVTQVVFRDQVGLVQHDLVGEGDLLDGLAAVGQSQQDVLGVDHGGDRIELSARLDVFIDEEGLRHRPGSARPVVSTMMASKPPLRFIRPDSTRIRSPRTVQQTQPLFISKTSSSAPTTRSLSMPTSPNSLTITA